MAGKRKVLTLGAVAALWAAGAGVSFASSSPRPGACEVPARYHTIQAAVDTPSCATIRVAPGTYHEGVIIARSLVLLGTRAGTDARGRRGAESTIDGDDGAAVVVNADNVTLDGFTLNGPVSQGSAALVMQLANSGETIQDNVFVNPGRAASITTSRTTFRHNQVKNLATAGDGFQANSNAVHDVTITDNAFGGADPSIYNADVTFIEGNKNLVVSDNRSAGDGTLVALFKTDGARVTGNIVTGAAASSAVYVGGGDRNVTVSDNTISGAGTAVKVADAFGTGANSRVTVTRNTLRKNQYGVNVAAGGAIDMVHVNRNTLEGNQPYGVFNDPSAPAKVDATCNWWGTPSGPGSRVSSGVISKPWLRTPSLSTVCR